MPDVDKHSLSASAICSDVFCDAKFVPESLAFVKELGSRIHQETREEMETSYLMQRLSMAIQRGNMAAVLGSLGHACNID